MYSTAPEQQAYRMRAIVFTSVIAGAFLTVFALVTLYGPSVAQEREQVVLIDLGTSLQFQENETSLSSAGLEKSHLPQKQTAAPISAKNDQEEKLLPDNSDALFPGMKSQEDGEGKDKTNTPGVEKNGTNVPGTYDHNGGSPDYSLGGRNCLFKPVMNSEISEEGKVVVNIWVDESGKVTRASINEANTNTNSQALRKQALTAARQTKWTEKNGMPEQKGHIVYKFVLK